MRRASADEAGVFRGFCMVAKAGDRTSGPLSAHAEIDLM